MILRLQLSEQPHVLDGNDGLVGKGLEQGDLVFGEGGHFASADEDCANGDALTQERSAESRAIPEPAGEISPDREVVGLGQIFDVEDPRPPFRLSGYGTMYRLAGAHRPGEWAMVSTNDQLVTVNGPEHGIDGTTYDARTT